MRVHFWIIRYFVILLAGLALAACSGGGGSEPDPVDPPPPAGPTGEAFVEIVSDRSTGTIGSDFQLTAQIFEAEIEIDSIEWTLPDGSVVFGETILVAFDTAGLATVSVEIIDEGEVQDTDDITLTVIEASDPTPDFLGLPDIFADEDGDGRVGLGDVLLAAQMAGELVDVGSEDRLRRFNLDFRGGITPIDAQLVAQALAQGEALPSALLDSAGAPGFIGTLVSPALLDAPDGRIEVSVDGEASPIVTQTILGYVSFMVPLEATSGGRDVELLLEIDGTVAETFTFSLLDAEVLPADAQADVLAVFDLVEETLLAEGRDVEVLSVETGASDDAGVLLKELYQAAAADIAAFRDILETEFAEEGTDEIAELMLILMNSNGLTEVREDAENLMSGSGTQGFAVPATLSPRNLNDPVYVCETFLPTACRVRVIADYTDDLLGAVNKVCKVSNLLFGRSSSSSSSGFSTDPDGEIVQVVVAGARLLKAINTFCNRTKVIRKVVKVVSDNVEDVEFRLRADPAQLSGVAGEDLVTRTSVRVSGLGLPCDSAAAVQDRLLDLLARSQALEFAIREAETPEFVSDLDEFFGTSFVDSVEQLKSSLSSSVGSLNDTIAAIDSFISDVCAIFAPNLPFPADKVFSMPPSTAGLLSFNGDTATYTCPSPGPGVQLNYLLQGSAPICGDTQRVQVSARCQATDVTITWGDNGTANDDIYELSIPAIGFTRTTSQPVTSISATVTLAPGDYEVRLIGRAAPDGIGTYFISFSGASVISGDALSGRDLTPGRVKTYTIRVQ